MDAIKLAEAEAEAEAAMLRKNKKQASGRRKYMLSHAPPHACNFVCVSTNKTTIDKDKIIVFNLLVFQTKIFFQTDQCSRITMFDKISMDQPL